MWTRLAPGSLLLSVVLMSGMVRADAPVSEKARALFRDGVAHLKAPDGPDYAEAYEDFKAAYADSPSSKILGNLGLCATKLERDGEAMAFYQRYLDEAGAKSPAERKAIQKDLEELKKRVAYVTLVVEPGVATVTDRRLPASGEPVINSYVVEDGRIELGLRSGSHRITIEAPSREPEVLELDLGPGAREEREVILSSTTRDTSEASPAVAPDPDTEADDTSDGGSGLMTGVWIGVGLTGALAIGTGVVGGMAASNFGKYEDAVAAGDDAEAADLEDKGKTLNLVGDILLGATIAGAATTGVLLTLALIEDDDEEGVAVRPIVGPGYVGVGGRF